MANVAYHQLFGRPTITRLVSRIKTPQSRFQQFLGMQPDGPNTDSRRGMTLGWDIMDVTRAIAPGRPPNTGPANLAPIPVSQVTAAAMRTHGKVELMENRIFNTRPLGGNYGQNVDVRGQRYVTRQTRQLAQKFRNAREFMVSRMLRGDFQIKISGDDWILVDSGGHLTVDYQIPAGNKSKLDLVGGGDILGTSWDNAASDIFLNILDINSAFEELHGRPLRHVWCNSTVINEVMNNTGLQAKVGTANRVFQTFAPEGQAVDGIEDTGFRVVMGALPWLTWHVYDAGLDVDGTFAKFLDDTHAIFLPDWDGEIGEWIEGSELQRAEKHLASFEATGLTAWTTRDIDPPRIDLKSLDIGLPALYIPKAVAYGLVIF